MKNKRKFCKYLIQILAVISILFNSCKNNESTVYEKDTGSFTDPRDGKLYKTVKIGTQWLMAENLAYKPDKGNYWVLGDDTSNVARFGYLYNWETAKKAAPEGWHLPSAEEWKMLRKSVGGKRDLIKSLGGTMEKVYYQMIQNGPSGFNALLGGCRTSNGSYLPIGIRADFWSSTNAKGLNANGPWHYIFNSRDSTAYLGSVDLPSCGKSVRLFKD